MFAKDDLVTPQEEAILEESSNFNKSAAPRTGDRVGPELLHHCSLLQT